MASYSSAWQCSSVSHISWCWIISKCICICWFCLAWSTTRRQSLFLGLFRFYFPYLKTSSKPAKGVSLSREQSKHSSCSSNLDEPHSPKLAAAWTAAGPEVSLRVDTGDSRPWHICSYAVVVLSKATSFASGTLTRHLWWKIYYDLWYCVMSYFLLHFWSATRHGCNLSRSWNISTRGWIAPREELWTTQSRLVLQNPNDSSKTLIFEVLLWASAGANLSPAPASPSCSSGSSARALAGTSQWRPLLRPKIRSIADFDKKTKIVRFQSTVDEVSRMSWRSSDLTSKIYICSQTSYSIIFSVFPRLTWFYKRHHSLVFVSWKLQTGISCYCIFFSRSIPLPQTQPISARTVLATRKLWSMSKKCFREAPGKKFNSNGPRITAPHLWQTERFSAKAPFNEVLVFRCSFFWGGWLEASGKNRRKLMCIDIEKGLMVKKLSKEIAPVFDSVMHILIY